MIVNPKVSPPAAVLVIVSLLSLTGVVEYAAMKAHDPPRQTVDAQYCLKCHNDPAILQKMKDKEGQAHFLFDKTGKLKSCPASALAPILPKPAPPKSW